MNRAGNPDPRSSSGRLTVESLLARYEPLVPPVSGAGAAVSIVLREGASGPEILLIERATSKSDPASGQVALPGGHVADGDGSLVATALRELEEEVGLTQQDLAGPVRYVRTELARRFGLKVAIFAASLSAEAGRPASRSPQEVAHVFWLPSDELAKTRTVREGTPRGELAVPATVFEGHVLWGFTRRILREFFGFPVEGELGGPAFPSEPERDGVPVPPEDDQRL
jgi:8-oxo-dGTP pyrophosphatase MutT (NUDIX family)